MRYEYRETDEVLDIIRTKDDYKYTIRLFKGSSDVALIVERLEQNKYRILRVVYGRFNHDKLIRLLNEDGFEKTFITVEKEILRLKHK